MELHIVYRFGGPLFIRYNFLALFFTVFVIPKFLHAPIKYCPKTCHGICINFDHPQPSLLRYRWCATFVQSIRLSNNKFSLINGSNIYSIAAFLINRTNIRFAYFESLLICYLFVCLSNRSFLILFD